MKKNNIQMVARVALVILPLMTLPGCGVIDWVKEQLGMVKPQTREMSDFGSMSMSEGAKTTNRVDDGSDILVTVKGSPAITMQMLEDEVKQLIDSRPELKDAFSKMPGAKQNVLMGLIAQLIVDEWAMRNMIHETPEFKKELEKAGKQFKRAVSAQFFAQAHPVSVSDAEVRAFYDKNKDMVQGKEFNEVKDILRSMLEGQKQMEHFEKLINQYKDEYGVEVNEDVLKSEGGSEMPVEFSEEIEEMPANAMQNA